MNYIQNLKMQIEEKDKEISELKEKIHSLKIYLSSSKFKEDTTVQVQDIFNRLE
jgi:predicted RNase H-like nuclease (RuvC/YqgF family)